MSIAVQYKKIRYIFPSILYLCSMFEPIPLNLPPYPLRISTDGKRHYIFDELRRKHLVWTPEEWVRQHWIQHLIEVKKYPRALIRAEGGLRMNEMQRRSDLLIFDPTGREILLAEFKRPSVPIGPAVFEQISRYNSVYKIPLLMVSNGLQHYYWEVDRSSGTYRFLDDLPDYGGSK